MSMVKATIPDTHGSNLLDVFHQMSSRKFNSLSTGKQNEIFLFSIMAKHQSVVDVDVVVVAVAVDVDVVVVVVKVFDEEGEAIFCFTLGNESIKI